MLSPVHPSVCVVDQSKTVEVSMWNFHSTVAPSL